MIVEVYPQGMGINYEFHHTVVVPPDESAEPITGWHYAPEYLECTISYEADMTDIKWTKEVIDDFINTMTEFHERHSE